LRWWRDEYEDLEEKMKIFKETTVQSAVFRSNYKKNVLNRDLSIYQGYLYDSLSEFGAVKIQRNMS
jgi:heme oxygenase